MDGNLELLNYIYQNSEMGRNTMQKLMTVTDDPNFRSVLEKQYGEYKDIYNQAENKINAKKQNAKKINPIERASSYVMLNMQIMSDKSPSKLSLIHI